MQDCGLLKEIIHLKFLYHLKRELQWWIDNVETATNRLSLKQGTGNRGMGMGTGNGNGEWEWERGMGICGE